MSFNNLLLNNNNSNKIKRISESIIRKNHHKLLAQLEQVKQIEINIENNILAVIFIDFHNATRQYDNPLEIRQEAFKE